MGEDKAFLTVGEPGELLWERQLGLLGSLGAERLMVSRNADQEFVLPEGVDEVVDEVADRGPLAGVVSCLRQSQNRRMLVLAVDLPNMNAEFLGSLLAREGGVVLRDSESERYEAVVAIYTPECLGIAERRLGDGQLAMQGFIGECVEAGLIEVEVLGDAQRGALANLNNPEDLAAFT